jgi:glycerol-3-phosphate dehydrogenase
MMGATGPSFAKELAMGLATAVVVASESEKLANEVRCVLNALSHSLSLAHTCDTCAASQVDACFESRRESVLCVT